LKEVDFHLLLASIREGGAILRGEIPPSRVFEVNAGRVLPIPATAPVPDAQPSRHDEETPQVTIPRAEATISANSWQPPARVRRRKGRPTQGCS